MCLDVKRPCKCHSVGNKHTRGILFLLELKKNVGLAATVGLDKLESRPD